MMRNHIPQETAVCTARGSCILHPAEHSVEYRLDLRLIIAHVLAGIGHGGAAGEGGFHVGDTPRLFAYDVFGNLPDCAVVRKAQDVFGHLYGSSVVGNHLYNEIVGNAVCQFRTGHALYHPVQDTVEGAQIFLCVSGRAGAGPAAKVLHSVP